MGRIDARFEHVDARFDRIDSRFNELEARMEARIEASKSESIRWTVGIAMGQYALMFALFLFIISRELPR